MISSKTQILVAGSEEFDCRLLSGSFSSDLIDKQFGRLTFESPFGLVKNGNSYARVWLFSCLCGTKCFICRERSVLIGLTKSCGCLLRNDGILKTCTKCGNKKENHANNFHRSLYRTSGLDSICKACRILKDRPRLRKIMRLKRIKLLESVGGGLILCQCCKENTVDFLAIDHINGDGNIHRKALAGRRIDYDSLDDKYKDKLRILCHNCNSSYAKYGMCPHKTCIIKSPTYPYILSFNSGAVGYHQSKKAISNSWIRNKAIDYYSQGTYKCECCEEPGYAFLTIDHRGGGGNLHRRTIKSPLYYWLMNNNYPQGFGVLCYNCNLGKSFCDKGDCPHVCDNAAKRIAIRHDDVNRNWHDFVEYSDNLLLIR